MPGETAQVRVIGTPAGVAAVADLIRQQPGWEVVRESSAPARRAGHVRLYIDVCAGEVRDAG
ncbi:hypothetical protein [Sphaerisporangium sp. TRM90804]|uniref:hypothetical protein n=1 Tax=Sphaerisporangium sp. TRM90804 TaxID=3031113 RepID=UPI00244823F3|nr:hypothetical protein [Sphaerisporangium sp. TRM90804]MDH2425733.1 hypothetical protein [Sphaerisporangium sp. TRM90804]